MPRESGLFYWSGRRLERRLSKRNALILGTAASGQEGRGSLFRDRSAPTRGRCKLRLRGSERGNANLYQERPTRWSAEPAMLSNKTSYNCFLVAPIQPAVAGACVLAASCARRRRSRLFDRCIRMAARAASGSLRAMASKTLWCSRLTVARSSGAFR